MNKEIQKIIMYRQSSSNSYNSKGDSLQEMMNVVEELDSFYSQGMYADFDDLSKMADIYLHLDAYLRFDEDIYDSNEQYENRNAWDEDDRLYEKAYNIYYKDLENRKRLYEEKEMMDEKLKRLLSLKKSESIEEEEEELDDDMESAEELLEQMKHEIYVPEEYWEKIDMRNYGSFLSIVNFSTSKSFTIKELDLTLSAFLFIVPKDKNANITAATAINWVKGNKYASAFLKSLKLSYPIEPYELNQYPLRGKYKERFDSILTITRCIKKGQKIYLPEFAYYSFKERKGTLCNYVQLYQKKYKGTNFPTYRKDQIVTSYIAQKITKIVRDQMMKI